eukprot:2983973-Rhodomonas_salina.2
MSLPDVTRHLRLVLDPAAWYRCENERLELRMCHRNEAARCGRVQKKSAESRKSVEKQHRKLRASHGETGGQSLRSGVFSHGSRQREEEAEGNRVDALPRA